MIDRIGEPVGFLCRWCLLVLAGLVVLVASAAVATTAGFMTADVCPKLAASDILCAEFPGKTTIAACHPLSQMPVRRHSLLLASAPPDELKVSNAYRGMLTLRFARDEPQRQTVRIIGSPYGALAFYRNSILVQVVARTDEVFLVDSDFVANLPADQDDAWNRATQAMRRLGAIGIIHRGTAEEYNQIRSVVRAKHPDLPVLLNHSGQADPVRVVRRVAWGLSVAKHETIMPQIVTADAQLAGQAGQLWFPAYLIAADIPNLKNVSSFATIDDFASRLAARADAERK